jgi:hypothetical protein
MKGVSLRPRAQVSVVGVMSPVGGVALCVSVAAAVFVLLPGIASAEDPLYSSAVLQDRPTAYYEFADAPGATAYVDSSGNGNTATSDPSDHLGAPGPFGSQTSALAIGDDGAQGPAMAPLQGDNTRTVELWFKTANSGDQCLLSSGSKAHAKAFSVCLTNGKQYGAPPPMSPGVYIQTWDADVYIPGLTLTDGRWHYIAVELTGSALTVDVDGATPGGFVWNGSSYTALSTQPFSLPSTPNTAATPVGIGAAGWGPVFNGEVAEVAIYDHALGPERLAAHLTAAGATASGLPINLSPPSIRGTAQAGQTLTVIPGTWTESPTLFEYQWYSCTPAGACSPIAGARAQTYQLAVGDAGRKIEVQETAANAAGRGSPATSQGTFLVGLPTPPPPPACPVAVAHTASYQTPYPGCPLRRPPAGIARLLRCRAPRHPRARGAHPHSDAHARAPTEGAVIRG